MKTVNEYFKQIAKVHKALKLETCDKKYYETEDLLKKMLKDLSNRDDILNLTKENLLYFLVMCSTYRPREPWQILVSISIAWDEKNKIKEGIL